jgi:CRP/FNR family transcriptional regulator, anaerobic regulatory protein
MNSYVSESPSRIGMQAIEKTYLFGADKKFIDKMILKHQEVATHYRKHMEEYFILIEQDLLAFQSMEAKKRYDFLLEKNSAILLRAPLGHIASYLGITQPTLSRLRAKKKSYSFPRATAELVF